jgi:hypothetical protein
MRFQVIEMFKHNYQKAEADCNIEGMNAAASGIARFTNLDKEDLETSWDELVPPDMEPSNDVKVLNENLKHYSDSEREQIRRKYLDIVND